jgi:uroporphyrinogen-III synthase
MNQTIERPLLGRRVWITRPQSQSRSLFEQVRAGGGEALIIPAIEISKKQISEQEIRLLQGLVRGDILIFISVNAARFIGMAVADPASRFRDMTLLAVGSGTSKALMERGFSKVISPERGSGSEALLQLELLQEASVRGRKIIILRGAGGRELLRDTLLRRGAKVGIVELYYRTKPSLDVVEIKKIWRQSPPDVIVITSGEALKNLIEITPRQERAALFNTPLVVISDRVRELAISSGFNLAPRIAGNAGDNELMQAIISLFRGNNK